MPPKLSMTSHLLRDDDGEYEEQEEDGDDDDDKLADIKDEEKDDGHMDCKNFHPLFQSEQDAKYGLYRTNEAYKRDRLLRHLVDANQPLDLPVPGSERPTEVAIMDQLQREYPWTKQPLIVSAPMRLISGPELAAAVSRAGGLGFIAAGDDVSQLRSKIKAAIKLVDSHPRIEIDGGVLPFGIGFLNWGADLEEVVKILGEYYLKPAAIWFFAPRSMQDLLAWTCKIRMATKSVTKIWIQVGTVASAIDVVRNCVPDVLVVQGSDAGGHGSAQSSSIITLLPEVADALIKTGMPTIPLIAAGGVMDGRGVAASMMLGACGVCMGTRFLASEEAIISKGYQNAILEAKDGGVSTVRTSLYDKLRGTTSWPPGYNGRAVINLSYKDSQNGISDDMLQNLHDEALKIGDRGWGEKGRLTTYAGTGVGLINNVLPAQKIIEVVLAQTGNLLPYYQQNQQGKGSRLE